MADPNVTHDFDAYIAYCYPKLSGQEVFVFPGDGPLGASRQLYLSRLGARAQFIMEDMLLQHDEDMNPQYVHKLVSVDTSIEEFARIVRLYECYTFEPGINNDYRNLTYRPL